MFSITFSDIFKSLDSLNLDQFPTAINPKDELIYWHHLHSSIKCGRKTHKNDLEPFME